MTGRVEEIRARLAEPHKSAFHVHAARDIAFLLAKLERAEALAEKWEREAVEACDGGRHGQGCPDCASAVYAGELRAELGRGIHG